MKGGTQLYDIIVLVGVIILIFVVFYWAVTYGAQLDEEILHSIESLEFSHLAKFAFNLCQKLNAYYHASPSWPKKIKPLKA
jgi:hypothetical protein